MGRFSQLTNSEVRRIGPSASAVLNTSVPRWLTHEFQNRKPSSDPGGLKASMLSRTFTTLKVLVSRGVATARFFPVGTRLAAAGWAARENGRNWFLMIG